MVQLHFDGLDVGFLKYRYDSETEHYLKVTPIIRGEPGGGQREILKGSTEARDLHPGEPEAIDARILGLRKERDRHRSLAEMAEEDIETLRGHREKYRPKRALRTDTAEDRPVPSRGQGETT